MQYNFDDEIILVDEIITELIEDAKSVGGIISYEKIFKYCDEYCLTEGGAFHNPPKIVAQVFKEALSNYNFETVEFAIFCRDDIPTSNYEVFKEVFEK